MHEIGRGRGELLPADKMRAAGVEVTTAGNEDKGSRRRPTGKCISTRYHLPVFYPRYAYTPVNM